MTRSLFAAADAHRDRIAVVGPEGVFTYADLVGTSSAVAGALLAGRDDLQGARVCYLAHPGWDHVATQWGIWRAGGLAVPLAVSHPPAELARVLDDADPQVVVADPTLTENVADLAGSRGLPLYTTRELMGGLTKRADDPRGRRRDPDPARPALMLYTSGTTGAPKGVVITHGNLQAQVASLVQAWGWSRDDHVLLVLPLHHVHGIVNVLTCALQVGGVCQMLRRYDTVATWERLAVGDVTLFMAVPTIYRRMLVALDGADEHTRRRWEAGARAAPEARRLRIGCFAGRRHAAVGGRHGRAPARAIRHDRDRNGAFQPPPGRAEARARGRATSRHGGPSRRRTRWPIRSPRWARPRNRRPRSRGSLERPRGTPGWAMRAP